MPQQTTHSILLHLIVASIHYTIHTGNLLHGWGHVPDGNCHVWNKVVSMCLAG